MATIEGQPGSIDDVMEDIAPGLRANVCTTPSSMLSRRPIVHPVIAIPAKNSGTSSVSDSVAPGTSTGFATLIIPVLVGVVTLVCFAWTLFLLALNVNPNAVVNRVMNTEEFDNGTFWQIIDPSSSLLAMAGFALGPVAVAYAFVLVDIVVGWSTGSAKSKTINTATTSNRQLPIEAIKDKIVPKIDSARTDRRFSIKDKVVEKIDGARTDSRFSSSAARLISEIARRDSTTRKLTNVWIKLADLAVQAALLVQLMERGLPLSLISLFAAIVSINAIVITLLMLLPRTCPIALIVMVQATLDTTFDFLVAVGHPIIVVIYCLSTEFINRELLAINDSAFRPGAFERIASVMADRVQVAIILETLYGIRIYSLLRTFTCLGSNLALCYRLHRLMVDWRSRQCADTKTMPQIVDSYPRRHPIAILFLLFTAAIVVLVEESVRTSTAACTYHPECSVHAWRWTLIKSANTDDDQHLRQCPCLTMIDIETMPSTFAEWQRPTDVADKVAQLAATNDLRTLQLVNRMLPTLPTEIRGCKQMKHLSLVYSHTTSFPDWAKELTQLEFLHIEGNPFGFLTYLPDDLFDDMESLTNLHVGLQIALERLPRFGGLVNLHSLTLAINLSLRELPAFDGLGKLQTLEIIMCPALDSIPDMAPLVSLRSFVTIDRGAFCCNGFRDVVEANVSMCDLSNPFCGANPMWGASKVECLGFNRSDKLMTPATRDIFDRFAMSVCTNRTLSPPEVSSANILKCNGTMYRECTMADNRTGMCYNSRMMPISCVTSVSPMEMRRLQIQRHVGKPCDPEYEAWLGCEE